MMANHALTEETSASWAVKMTDPPVADDCGVASEAVAGRRLSGAVSGGLSGPTSRITAIRPSRPLQSHGRQISQSVGQITATLARHGDHTVAQWADNRQIPRVKPGIRLLCNPTVTQQPESPG